MRRQEQTLQIAVVQFLQLAAPDLVFWATPNAVNTKNGKRAGAFNKAMGVRPGVADLQFLLGDGKTGFVELKSRTGVQTKSQETFEDDVNALGCPYVVCRSIDDVKVTLEDWGVKFRGSVAA